MHDLGVRHERGRLGVPLASGSRGPPAAPPSRCEGTGSGAIPIPPPTSSGRSTSRPEAVAERAEDVDRVAGLERGERARPGPDRVDQERELARRREAEAHRPRQQPPGRLEHEELARDRPARAPPRSTRSSVYGPTASVLRDRYARSRLSSIRSWRRQRELRARVRDRVHGGRGAGDRRDAGDARDERGLADPVAVRALQRAAERRVDDEVAAAAPDRGRRRSPRRPRRPSPPARPRARPPRARARCPRSRPARSRARRAPPPPARSAALVGVADREERRARWSAAAARRRARPSRTRSAGRRREAITSPVERISGPSTGSEPGKRANGSTAALTLTCVGGRSAGRPELAQLRAGGEPARGLDEVEPGRLATRTGTVRDARGFASST